MSSEQGTPENPVDLGPFYHGDLKWVLFQLRERRVEYEIYGTARHREEGLAQGIVVRKKDVELVRELLLRANVPLDIRPMYSPLVEWFDWRTRSVPVLERMEIGPRLLCLSALLFTAIVLLIFAMSGLL